MSNATMPAFPTSFDADHNGNVLNYASNGLTKLEYFAGLAMQGILANNASFPHTTQHFINIASDAKTAATTLITELEKHQ